MALTKADISQSIMDQIGYTKNKPTDVTETLLEIIKRSLSSGQDVLVSFFGSFFVKEKAERKGRNPAMMLKPRSVVTFKVSAKLGWGKS